MVLNCCLVSKGSLPNAKSMTAKKGAAAVLALQKAVYAEQANYPKPTPRPATSATNQQLQQTLDADLHRVSSEMQQVSIEDSAVRAGRQQLQNGEISVRELRNIEAVAAMSQAMEAVSEQYQTGQISKEEMHMIQEVIMMGPQI